MKLGEVEWHSWVRTIETIKADVQAIVNDDAIFQGFSEAVRANVHWIDQNHGTYFCHFVARCYAARASSGIRRHTKNNPDSVSLIRIMSQMQSCAPQLTFGFYLERFPRDPGEDFPWQEATFKQISEDGVVASAGMIARDLEEVERITSQVEAFVDKQIAHLDRKGFTGEVTFDGLASAVQKLDEVACKYICLLTGKGYRTLEATVQFDWKRIFTVPLVEPR
ncbi:MAG: hypothetical protein ACXWLM_06640 [Myxococcales bacterium]